MLSEDSSVSTKTNNFGKNGGTKTVLIVVFLVIIFLSSFIYWWFPKTESSWVIENTYSTYEGQTTILFLPLNVTIRLEVLDFINETHAEVLAKVKLETEGLPPKEDQKNVWIDLKNKIFEMEDSDLIDTYEEIINVEDFGTRNCIVYEYIAENMFLTVYLDKEGVWPIKMKYGLEGEFDLSLDLNLVETNIPELKK